MYVLFCVLFPLLTKVTFTAMAKINVSELAGLAEIFCPVKISWHTVYYTYMYVHVCTCMYGLVLRTVS
jgi:hypothetical protein